MNDMGEIIHYLLFYFIVDTRGCMVGERIATLNNALQIMLPNISALSKEKNVESYIKVMGYGTGAYWINEKPINVEEYEWKDLSASGLADMGAAFKLLAEDYNRISVIGKNFHPIVILFSCGSCTDNYIPALDALKAHSWFKKTLKYAIEIGNDADRDILDEFTGNPEAVLKENDLEWVLQTIRLDDDCFFDEKEYDYVSDFSEIYKMSSIEIDSTEKPLYELVNMYPMIWRDSIRIKNSLMDIYPNDKLIRNLLMACVDEGVTHELYSLGKCSKMDINRMAYRIVDAYGCGLSNAEEVVQLWADSLGVVIN